MRNECLEKVNKYELSISRRLAMAQEKPERGPKRPPPHPPVRNMVKSRSMQNEPEIHMYHKNKHDETL